MLVEYTYTNPDPPYDSWLADHHSFHFIAPWQEGVDCHDIQDMYKVFFDTDPVPVPVFAPPRTTNRQKCVRANLNGVITSGAAVVYDFGSADTDLTIDLIVPFVSLETKNWLQGLYRKIAPVWYYTSHSNQFTLCGWQSLNFVAYQGTPGNVFSCNVSLLALGSQITYREPGPAEVTQHTDHSLSHVIPD
jgi:hypothetical protein